MPWWGLLALVIFPGILRTDSLDTAMAGFDDSTTEEYKEKIDKTVLVPGLTGTLMSQIIYSPYGKKPHNDISSLRSFLYLDYEHKFENDFKVKANLKAFYDAIYSIKGRKFFTQDELNELESDVQIFDAYIEGSITESVDIKLGRQVVVWGRSDTIRVTDVLNPMYNRRPGILDIKYLRLPVTMAKFDYFVDNWRITPIAILEQRFSENPPYGSAFYPLLLPLFPPAEDKSYSDITYALSVGRNFSGWDINFYSARIRDDQGNIVFLPKPKIEHEKINMFGTAINVLTGPWLFKTEVAYFSGLKYTAVNDKSFSRLDVLLGVEYTGIDNTYISYDIAGRSFGNYDEALENEHIPLYKYSLQNAFRIRSDFFNATLTANYLIMFYGINFNTGGFQRLWVDYKISDDIKVTAGFVDYGGDSSVMQQIKDNDMFFLNLSYSF